MSAVGQDVGHIPVRVRGLFDPPVNMQLEIAEFALQPEVLVAVGLALGVIVDRASTTFQCPPSPSGIFQPARSRPLKSVVKPGGGSLSTAWAAVARLTTIHAPIAWRPSDRIQLCFEAVNVGETSIWR